MRRSDLLVVLLALSATRPATAAAAAEDPPAAESPSVADTPPTVAEAADPAAQPPPEAAAEPPPSEALDPQAAVTSPAAETDERAATRATLLHGDALAAELDGELKQALALLRQALALAPDDAAIRFDLARLAVLHGGERGDLEPFASSLVSDPASLALRAAVLAELDRRGQARPVRLWGGRVRLRATLGTSLDTNANIAPDEATPFTTGSTAPPAPPAAASEPLLGVRLAHQGEVFVAPLDGLVSVEAALGYRVGVYLNSGGTAATGELSALDHNQAWLIARGLMEFEPLVVRLTLSGSEHAAGGFSRHYLQAATAQLDLLLGDRRTHLGLYGLAGLRDFVDGNPTGAEDRDARLLQGGLLWTWRAGHPFGLRGRIGAGRELTDGPLLRTWNLVTSLATHVDVGRVHVLAGVYNDARVYNDQPPTDWSDVQDLRFDDRLTPFSRVEVDILAYLGAYAAYAYTTNLSNHDENRAPRLGVTRPHLDRTYQRHLLEIGVEGRL